MNSSPYLIKTRYRRHIRGGPYKSAELFLSDNKIESDFKHILPDCINTAVIIKILTWACVQCKEVIQNEITIKIKNLHSKVGQLLNCVKIMWHLRQWKFTMWIHKKLLLCYELFLSPKCKLISEVKNIYKICHLKKFKFSAHTELRK